MPRLFNDLPDSHRSYSWHAQQVSCQLHQALPQEALAYYYALHTGE